MKQNYFHFSFFILHLALIFVQRHHGKVISRKDKELRQRPVQQDYTEEGAVILESEIIIAVHTQ